MTTRMIAFKTRVATKEDIAATNDKPIWNTPYFCKRANGTFDSRLYLLTENTDMKAFKQLYANGQIYVIDNKQEKNTIPFNCIDWQMVDDELDFELQQLEKINTKA